jgi:hypothetical protein
VIDAATGGALLFGLGWLIGIPFDRRHSKQSTQAAPLPEPTEELVTTAPEFPPPSSPSLRGRRLAIASALVLSLVSVGAAGVLYSKMQMLDSRLTKVSSQLVDARLSARQLEYKLTTVADQNSRNEQTIRGLRADLSSQQASTVQFSDLTVIAVAIGKFRQCVNDYMDVVGASGGGYYRYSYC